MTSPSSSTTNNINPILTSSTAANASSSSSGSGSGDTDPVIVVPAERHFVDYLADMYAAVLCLERLERAHNRDLVPPEEYSRTLEKTLSRIKNIENQLNVAASSGLRYSGLDEFLQTYGVSQACGAARARLIEAARIEAERNAEKEKQASAAEQQKNAPTGPNPASVQQVTERFITLMDCLKVNERSVDSVYPFLQELLASIPRVHPQFEQLSRLSTWMTLLDSMKASDELNDEQVRDMTFDIERAYNAFSRWLESIWGSNANGTSNNNNVPSISPR